MQGAGGYGLNSPSAQNDLPTLLTVPGGGGGGGGTGGSTGKQGR